jgi:hypothetical protein
MPHFSSLYYATELAVLEQAYEDACFEVGLDPAAPDFSSIRDRLTAAIMDAARLGERDPKVLSAFAVAVGMRSWQLTDRRPH